VHAKNRPPLTKSQAMAAVRTKRTAPEEVVGAALRACGVRYRRNVKRLAGTPDFLICRLRVAIFVHGCFWHGHPRCRKGRTASKTNAEFWARKIELNRHRDRRVSSRVRAKGYSVFTVWECELINGTLPSRLVRSLHSVKSEHK